MNSNYFNSSLSIESRRKGIRIISVSFVPPFRLLVDKKDSCGCAEDFEDRNRSHSFQRSSYSTASSLAREENLARV